MSRPWGRGMLLMLLVLFLLNGMAAAFGASSQLFTPSSVCLFIFWLPAVSSWCVTGYWCPPDVAADSKDITSIAGLPNNNKFFGGVYAPSTKKIYGIPSYLTYVLIIDPSTNSRERSVDELPELRDLSC